MRNVPYVTKQVTLTQIPTILQNVVDAGKKLNLSNNRLTGSMQLLGKEYSNDPDYANYMALRNDSLMAIAGAMRGQGMSDYATKLENEAQHPTQSPRALEGWMRGQMAALAPKISQAHNVLRDIPAGTAVTPAAAPTMSAAERAKSMGL
jgi:hypothetical protein